MITQKQYITSLRLLLPSGLFIVIWAFIFAQTDVLTAGFNYFLDDHWILVNHRQYTSFYDIVCKPFVDIFSGGTDGRFRPLYDVFLRFFSQVYGLKPFIWYLSSCLVAITTTILFYVIGRLQRFSVLESIGFASLIVFGQQASTYARFGTPETTSTLLLAIALLFGSLNFENQRKQVVVDWLFICFAIFSALNKEACILLTPALCFFKALCLSKQSRFSLKFAFHRNKFNIFFLLTTFLIFIACIKFNNLQGTGYAGIDKDTWSIDRLFSSLNNNILVFQAALFTNSVYIIILLFRNRYLQIDNSYILIALLIIPQLILYNKTGMGLHYVLPAAVGIALLIIYPIQQLRQAGESTPFFEVSNQDGNLNFRSSKNFNSIVRKNHNCSGFHPIATLLNIVVLIVVFQQIIITQDYFKVLSDKLHSTQSMLGNISSCVGGNDKLLIVGNPYLSYESLYALHIITSETMKHNQTFLATIGSQKSHLITDDLKVKENEEKWYFLKPSSLEKAYNDRTINNLSKQDLSNITGIVIVNANVIQEALLKLNLDWFKPDILEREYSSHQQANYIQANVYCKNK